MLVAGDMVHAAGMVRHIIVKNPERRVPDVWCWPEKTCVEKPSPPAGHMKEKEMNKKKGKESSLGPAQQIKET